ncbi:MAG: hypothetical protein IKC32_00980 [Clostridia bacterium]|nr:hypothetical protein [Clostridia bacterium]
MSKNRIIALVALLLVGSLLLASCGDGDSSRSNYTPGAMYTENNHKSKIDKWVEYVSYDAPEAAPKAELAFEYENAEPASPFLVVTFDDEEIFKTVPAANPDEEDVSVHISDVETYKFYDIETGELLRSIESFYPAFFVEEGVSRVDESITLDGKSYSDLSLVPDYPLIEIKTETFRLKEATDPDTPLDAWAMDSYDLVESYTYLSIHGSPVLEDLKDYPELREVGNGSALAAGRFLLDSKEKNKTLLLDGEGRVIREFGYLMDYQIPVYDEESINVDGTGYAYFEAGDYEYVITEAAPQYMPVGDLYFYLVPGIDILIIGEGGEVTAHYSSECYGISGYAVLANGDIYVCEIERLNADAESYDVLSGEEKLNLIHKRISAKDGSVTELDLAFRASKLLNNTTKSIKSFINLTTLEATDPTNPASALLSSVRVKDGFMLAEIQKHEGGRLDPKTVYAVLNESLEIVGELPTILADQFTYPAFISETAMVVTARAVGTKLVYYSVNTETGKASLLPSLTSLVNIESFSGGYVWWNASRTACKIYDESFKLLKDYTKNENDTTRRMDFRLINGELYFYEYSAVADESIVPDRFTIVKLGVTRIEDGYDYENDVPTYRNELTETDVADRAIFFSDSLILTEDSDGYVALRNIEGEILVQESVEQVGVPSEALGINVSYERETSFYPIYTGDVTLLVKTVSYTVNGTNPEGSGLEDTFEEFKILVIK